MRHVSNKHQLVIKSHLYKITFSQFDLFFFIHEAVGEQQAGSVWNSNDRVDTLTNYNGPGGAEHYNGPGRKIQARPQLYSVSLIVFNCLKI